MTSYLEDVQIQSIVGDADKGGWECTLVALQDTDAVSKWQEVTIPFRFGSSDGWDEDWRTGLVGHALPLGFDFDRLLSGARFSVATSNRFLENAGLQGIPFADQSVCGAGPFNDHQIDKMRIGHIVEHILEHHCNISTATNPEGWADTSDIDTTNSSRVNRLNVHQTNNMWAALQELARFEFYYIYFSRDNAVHYIPHPMFGTLPASVMEFTGDFCVGRPTVQIHADKKVSQVKLWATDEDGAIYTSTWPASPSGEGFPLEMRKVRVGGAAPQTRLNALVRRVYDWHNRDYTVQWTAPGLSGLFFELLDRVGVTYDGPVEPAGVHVSWSDKKFWVHRVQAVPNPGHMGQTVFTLEEEPTIS